MKRVRGLEWGEGVDDQTRLLLIFGKAAAWLVAQSLV